MNTNIINTYNEIIEKIKNKKTTEAILLVGSSKKLDLEKEVPNDIDIFVFSKENKDQVREIEEIDGVVFDISYFSKRGIEKLITSREYFFIKELINPKKIYDKNENIQETINMCRKVYAAGPNNMNESEETLLKTNLKENILNISQEDEMESNFLTHLCLKDLISAYFILNNIWMPKDKNIIKSLKSEDRKLYALVYNKETKNNREYLLDIYNYIF